MESVRSMMLLKHFVDIPVSDSIFHMYIYIYIYHTVLPIKLVCDGMCTGLPKTRITPDPAVYCIRTAK